ncbi:peptidylprolyl isomerase [Anaerotignum sp. MB30-C6]|uniref:peptidylprolyl isomerase n=1 Tax=Anaerotignum sp. MB30-C6 TaxID=3070814 RepID=UPI0027DC0FFE|nr:SurA N-terminal domain-containing protein [Anaerotignum sp. MB30-C6]WMI81483.1 SurA N-terminal domain-containing protein [Anaerotignum sp. MB30-C6]
MKKKGLLCLLTAGVMALSACGSTSNSNSSNFNDEVVMKVDGREIMKSEYMVYLYTTTKSFTAVGGDEIWTMDFDGQTADELVEERTLNTLQSVVAATKYAEENNIALTDAQKEEAVKSSEQFVSSLPKEDIEKMGVDAKKLAPFMEGSYLYSLVYQALAAECEVDEGEKAKYYEENKDQMKDDYTLLDMDTIVLNDLEKANEVVEKARAGEDFKSLFDEYDVDENSKKEDEGGKLSLYKTQFTSSFGLTDVPEVGVVTEPILMDDVYFVLKINNITVPQDSEVKTVAETSFANLKQAEYSDARFEEMVAAQKVEFIEGVYENLEKFH